MSLTFTVRKCAGKTGKKLTVNDKKKTLLDIQEG
jgi:hypothetical protein